MIDARLGQGSALAERGQLYRRCMSLVPGAHRPVTISRWQAAHRKIPDKSAG